MSEEWTFTFKLAGTEIDVVQLRATEHDAHDKHAELTIVWEADFDVRSWGIKGINPVVHKVTGFVQYTDPDSGDTVESIPISYPKEPTDHHLEVILGRKPAANADPKEWTSYYGPGSGQWTIETEVEGARGVSLSLWPKYARINLRTQAILIQF